MVGIFHSPVGLGCQARNCLPSVFGPLVSPWVGYTEITTVGRPCLHPELFVNTFLFIIIIILPTHWKVVFWIRLILIIWLSFFINNRDLHQHHYFLFTDFFFFLDKIYLICMNSSTVQNIIQGRYGQTFM